jgi:hypothetical protein
MGFLFQCGAGWGRRVVPAVAMLGLGWGVARAAGPANAWDAAVKARERFEAEPAGTHTKAEYAQVMDGFRVIYHSDPGAAHAPRAVEQVAELLAEQGRELGDRKSLRDAAGQYCFLAKAYPGGALAEHALESALALLGPDAANDAVELAKVKAELAVEYPRAVVAGAPAGLSTAPSQKREGSGREDKVVVAAARDCASRAGCGGCRPGEADGWQRSCGDGHGHPPLVHRDVYAGGDRSRSAGRRRCDAI